MRSVCPKLGPCQLPAQVHELPCLGEQRTHRRAANCQSTLINLPVLRPAESACLYTLHSPSHDHPDENIHGLVVAQQLLLSRAESLGTSSILFKVSSQQHTVRALALASPLNPPIPRLIAVPRAGNGGARFFCASPAPSPSSHPWAVDYSGAADRVQCSLQSCNLQPATCGVHLPTPSISSCQSSSGSVVACFFSSCTIPPSSTNSHESFSPVWTLCHANFPPNRSGQSYKTTLHPPVHPSVLIDSRFPRSSSIEATCSIEQPPP